MTQTQTSKQKLGLHSSSSSSAAPSAQLLIFFDTCVFSKTMLPLSRIFLRKVLRSADVKPGKFWKVLESETSAVCSAVCAHSQGSGSVQLLGAVVQNVVKFVTSRFFIG